MDNDIINEANDEIEDDEWALIFAADGTLRSVIIPEGGEDDPVPEVISQIMSDYFGVDFSDDNTEDADTDGDLSTDRVLH